MEPESKQTFYQVLQIEPTANVMLIRYACRLLLAAYDPEKNLAGDAERHELIEKIWSVLSNNETREQYDKELKEAGLWLAALDPTRERRCSEINAKMLTTVQNKWDTPLLDSVEPAPREDVPLPEVAEEYVVEIVCRMNPENARSFSRLAINPCNMRASLSGLFFLCGESIWTFEKTGVPFEYARVRGSAELTGLAFDQQGSQYATTSKGTIYLIAPNKSGRIVAQLEAGVSDVVWNDSLKRAIVSNTNGGIVAIDRQDEQERLDDISHIYGMLVESRDSLACFVPEAGSILRLDFTGHRLSETFVADPECFSLKFGRDGNMARDAYGNIYLTASRVGAIYRVTPDGHSEIVFSKLHKPTGIAIVHDGSIFILESDAARIIRINKSEASPVA